MRKFLFLFFVFISSLGYSQKNIDGFCSWEKKYTEKDSIYHISSKILGRRYSTSIVMPCGYDAIFRYRIGNDSTDIYLNSECGYMSGPLVGRWKKINSDISPLLDMVSKLGKKSDVCPSP